MKVAKKHKQQCNYTKTFKLFLKLGKHDWKILKPRRHGLELTTFQSQLHILVHHKIFWIFLNLLHFLFKVHLSQPTYKIIGYFLVKELACSNFEFVNDNVTKCWYWGANLGKNFLFKYILYFFNAIFFISSSVLKNT